MIKYIVLPIILVISVQMLHGSQKQYINSLLRDTFFDRKVKPDSKAPLAKARRADLPQTEYVNDDDREFLKEVEQWVKYVQNKPEKFLVVEDNVSVGTLVYKYDASSRFAGYFLVIDTDTTLYTITYKDNGQILSIYSRESSTDDDGNVYAYQNETAFEFNSTTPVKVTTIGSEHVNGGLVEAYTSIQYIDCDFGTDNRIQTIAFTTVVDGDTTSTDTHSYVWYNDSLPLSITERNRDTEYEYYETIRTTYNYKDEKPISIVYEDSTGDGWEIGITDSLEYTVNGSISKYLTEGWDGETFTLDYIYGSDGCLEEIVSSDYEKLVAVYDGTGISVNNYKLNAHSAAHQSRNIQLSNTAHLNVSGTSAIYDLTGRKLYEANSQRSKRKAAGVYFLINRKDRFRR